MLLMIVPAVIYAVMFFGQAFPATERRAAGVPFGDMWHSLSRPLFIVIFLCMWLTAATELGPGQWVSNIFNDVMHSTVQAGVLVLVWINGIMYLMRQFGGARGASFHTNLSDCLHRTHRGTWTVTLCSSAIRCRCLCCGCDSGHWNRLLVADDARNYL